jgi:hypothetical protein
MLVLVGGMFVDALYHAAPSSPMSGLVGPDGHNAHLLIFVGMLLVMASVIRQGLRGPVRTTHSK